MLKFVIEQGRETRVPALGELRRNARRALFTRVVIDVEVFGRQDAEIEVDVLDLVAAKVLACAEPTAGSAARRPHDTTTVHGSHLVPLVLRLGEAESGRARFEL